MRSIRRSLTVYLLALLTIALAVVGTLIDQVIGRTLAARRSAAIELIDAQAERHLRDQRKQADDDLLQEARKLGSEVRSQYRLRYEREYRVLVTGRLLNGLLPNVAGSPLFIATTTTYSWSASGRLFRDFLARQSHDEDVFRHLDESDRSHDYFQLNGAPTPNNPTGSMRWRSESLERETIPLPHKPAEDWQQDHLDDVALVPSGQAVRRVVIKVPLGWQAFRARGRGPTGPPRPDDRRRGPPPSDDRRRGLPPPGNPGETFGSVYVQCARPIAVLDESLAVIRRDRDAQVATATAEVRAERTELRGRLIVVGLIAFAAIAFGAPLLMRAGLQPLRALSEAVRRVSEKDFKLPHDGRGLPRELTAIHARLTQTLDMLSRAFSREKQAVADISHELRTPIASLQATLDVALRKPRTPEQYRTTLEDCRIINRQLGQLVERIMTLASLDAGNDRTSMLRVDAAEIATACATVIRPLAVAHGLTLEMHLESPLELDADPDKLREVLSNLLHNAVEYNRPGGCVEVCGMQQGNRVVFEVRDTGIGMSAEVRERIFERFFRADPSRQATGIHAGLGLAIVREYVDRLGGTVSVASEPGQGTCFHLEFPAPQDSNSSIPAPSRAPEPMTIGS